MASRTSHLPTWLKQGVWACHTPTRTWFQPRKCQQCRNSRQEYLVDAHGQDYLLSECSKADLQQAETGILLIVTDGPPMTAYRDKGGLRLESDSQAWKILLPEPDEGLAAVRSLSEFFNGALVDDPDHLTWNALKLGEGQ